MFVYTLGGGGGRSGGSPLFGRGVHLRIKTACIYGAGHIGARVVTG